MERVIWSELFGQWVHERRFEPLFLTATGGNWACNVSDPLLGLGSCRPCPWLRRPNRASHHGLEGGGYHLSRRWAPTVKGGALASGAFFSSLGSVAPWAKPTPRLPPRPSGAVWAQPGCSTPVLARFGVIAGVMMPALTPRRPLDTVAPGANHGLPATAWVGHAVTALTGSRFGRHKAHDSQGNASSLRVR